MRVGESASGNFFRNALLVAVLIFMLAPLLIVVVNSFNVSRYNAWPPTGFTLDWYAKALNYDHFRKGMVNSLIISPIVTISVLIIGSPIAYALARFRFEGAAFIKALLFGPLIVPRVAIGFAFFVLYLSTRSGLYGTYTGMILSHICITLPFVVTILIATLGEIDPALEEAARDLGATPFGAFRLAVLPQMRSGLVVAGLFAFVMSFDDVETAIFLSKPATNTLALELFLFLEQYQDPTAAAISTLLIAFSLLVVILMLLFARGKTLLRLVGGKHD